MAVCGEQRMKLAVLIYFSLAFLFFVLFFYMICKTAKTMGVWFALFTSLGMSLVFPVVLFAEVLYRLYERKTK